MNTNTIGIGGYFCAKKKKKKEVCGEFLSVVVRLEEVEVSETLYIYCPPGSLSLVLSFFCRVFFVFISCLRSLKLLTVLLCGRLS
jgi:hypothetical protein